MQQRRSAYCKCSSRENRRRTYGHSSTHYAYLSRRFSHIRVCLTTSRTRPPTSRNVKQCHNKRVGRVGSEGENGAAVVMCGSAAEVPSGK